MGYSCFTEDGNQAAILATMVETGDVIAVCGDHVIDYALGLLEAATGVKWEPATGYGTDPNTGEATDEDETGDGPATETAPAPLDPPGGAPGPADDDDDLGLDPAEDEYEERAYAADELAHDKAHARS